MSVRPIADRNPSFGLDMAARDCPPLQFVRELTMNALESIDERHRTELPGSFPALVVWRAFKDLGEQIAAKLCCIDTGTGMTADELNRYIGGLASSGKTQALNGNYGMGAKVAGAAFSPAGLTYLSWTGDPEEGWTCTLLRDDEQGWGLQEPHPGGYLQRAPAGMCPPEIAQAGYRGTVVVLYGRGDDHDTVSAPQDLGTDWLLQTLNDRFLRFPTEVKVCAQRPGETVVRRAGGHLAHLEKHVEQRGTVNLRDADVHWYILHGEHRRRVKDAGRHTCIGHRAAIHAGELFDMRTISAGGFRSLQAFGIHSGYQRVVLLVEPISAEMDTTRGRLLLSEDGASKELPWDRWADEFAAAMPEALRDLVAESAGSAARRDRKDLMRRLQEIADVMPMPIYLADPDGDERTTPPVHGSRDSRTPQASRRRARSGSRPGSARGGDVVSLFMREDGEPAKRKTGAIPEIRPEWVSRAGGQRPPGVLEDLAATFLLRDSLVQISEDFRGYRVLLDHFLACHADVPSAAPIVEQEVKAACEDQVIEFIVGALRVRCEPHWNTGRIESALSEEALTSCLMQHASLGARIQERLNRRLTRRGKAAA